MRDIENLPISKRKALNGVTNLTINNLDLDLVFDFRKTLNLDPNYTTYPEFFTDVLEAYVKGELEL